MLPISYNFNIRNLEKFKRQARVYLGSLHLAALMGQFDKVQEIIYEDASMYLSRTKKSSSNAISAKILSETTILHCALLYGEHDTNNDEMLNAKFAVVHFLLENEQCNQIINVVDSCNISILSLIANWPNQEQSIELTHLALQKGAFIDDNLALEMAIFNFNVGMIELLISHNINLNQLGGSHKTQTNFEILIERFIKSIESGVPQTEKFNAILSLLIQANADINLTGDNGKTLVDLIEDANLREYLQEDILLSLADVQTSTAEEIAKRKKIFKAIQPLTLFSVKSQSPFYQHVPLLVELKRQRRQNNGSDYDCTVLDGTQQLREFLQLTKLRLINESSLQTQFLVRPRESGHPHLANGQLTIDEEGNVTFFWIDSLGHQNHQDTIIDNDNIGKIVLEEFPEATLYTVDKQLQHTAYGCYIFVLYLAEQLSKNENINIARDLLNIWQEFGSEDTIFRIIPWERCPVYTGIPRMIHSVKAPRERMLLNLEEDSVPINKKRQNYAQAINAHITFYRGKEINGMYDYKRLKFGQKLKEALVNFSDDELLRMEIAGATDVIGRIPPEILINQYQVTLEQQDDESWMLSIPVNFVNLSHATILSEEDNKAIFIAANLEEMQIQTQALLNTLITDAHKINMEFSLHKYAALTGANHLIEILKVDNLAQLSNSISGIL